MTTISRDRIQFEDLANEVNDGNEQMHRDAAGSAWETAASDYLAANGGGSASVRIGKDHTRFAVTGDRAIADAADAAGWDVARRYIEEQVAAISELGPAADDCPTCHGDPSLNCPDCAGRGSQLIEADEMD